MEPKKTVFIASSSKAKSLAEALTKYLTDSMRDGVDVRPWYRQEQFPLSNTIFGSLVRQTNECDFAVVLLTQDDYEEKKGKKLFSPRDNTVLELGLFAGELGIERCFMISNADPSALPSDVDGFLRCEFSSDIDITTDDGVKQALDAVGSKILEAISDQKPFAHPKLPVITVQQLQIWERGKKLGGQLDLDSSKAAVIVNSVEPVEQTNLEFCVTVLANLRAGAQYEYYYGDIDDNLKPTAKLVVNVATAELQLKELPLKDNLDLIKRNLNVMKGAFSIHFRKRPPLQFCVHNALSDSDATCYLRCCVEGFQGSFVRLAKGREAKDVAADLRLSCPSHQNKEYIFHTTNDVQIKRAKVVDTLRRAIPEELPEVFFDELTNVCVGKFRK